MTPEDVARIVERRNEAAFVELLRKADAEFEVTAFEAALAGALRTDPALIDQWNVWSGDRAGPPARPSSMSRPPGFFPREGPYTCVSTPMARPLWLTLSIAWLLDLLGARCSRSRGEAHSHAAFRWIVGMRRGRDPTLREG
jgi:hypothetical protein